MITNNIRHQTQIFSMSPLGITATLRHQVDEGVTGLSQLCNGNPASLFDELSH